MLKTPFFEVTPIGPWSVTPDEGKRNSKTGIDGTMNAVKAIRMEEPAADHLATIDWQRGAWSDKKGKYSRQHLWVLAGTKLKASESGAVMPAAYRDKTPIDPHNMFVATIASAHMLTWLHMVFSMDIEVRTVRGSRLWRADRRLRAAIAGSAR